MDRGKFSGLKQWRCDGDPSHVLGLLRRIQSSVLVDGTMIHYHTTQIMLFREAVDLRVGMPDEIEVVGSVEGLMLTSMKWTCTCCGNVKTWHPGEDAVLWIKMNGRKGAQNG